MTQIQKRVHQIVSASRTKKHLSYKNYSVYGNLSLKK